MHGEAGGPGHRASSSWPGVGNVGLCSCIVWTRLAPFLATYRNRQLADPWGHRGETVTGKAKKRRELRSFRLVTVASAALTVLFLAWVQFGIGGPTATKLFSNLVQSGTALIAAAACFSAARRNPYGFGRAWTTPLPRAWRLRGWAPPAGGLGQVVWTIHELRLPEDATVPVPSLADLGYLATLPLLIAGVLAFPTAPMRATARLRTLLDGVLIAASLLFLGWATVL